MHTPSPSPRRRLIALLVLCLIVPFVALHGQTTASTLVVRVTDERGQPVPQATVTASQGGTLRQTRVTLEDGTASMVFASGESVTIEVRRIGYTPAGFTMRVVAVRETAQLTVVRFATTLERVRVVGERTISGIVASRSEQRPVRGAVVRMVGERAGRIVTDSTGVFVLPIGDTQGVTLEVSATGYEPVIVAERMEPAVMSRELLVLLTSLDDVGNTRRIALDDQARRLRWRARESAVLGGRELRATGARTMADAMSESPGAREKGLRVTDAACVFIDGRPQPGVTVASMPVLGVRLAEVYGARGDYVGSLAERWPKNAPCGSANRRPMAGEAVWVVIWTQQ